MFLSAVKMVLSTENNKENPAQECPKMLFPEDSRKWTANSNPYTMSTHHIEHASHPLPWGVFNTTRHVSAFPCIHFLLLDSQMAS